jgi:hypothetical protein
MKRVFQAGAAYFAWAFGAGFVLGVVRQLWAVPRYGERAAELLEMPFMAVVIVLVARHVVHRYAVPPTLLDRSGMGLVGLALLLLAEWGVILSFRQQSVAGYIAARDPIAGVAYLVMLLAFALMPIWIQGRWFRR